MSSHHDQHDHPVSESKPISFGVPLILGLVAMFIIVLAVSLGDPCHCCHDEKCEAEATEHHGGAAAHHEAAAEETHEHEATHTEAVADTLKKDTTAMSLPTVTLATEPVKEVHEEAHH